MASPDLHSLIEAARTAPVRADTPARVVPLIDLTSLKGGESPAEIEALCARAVAYGTAAVCIYAEAVPIARPLLAGSAVRVATVANFPHGGDDVAGTAEGSSRSFEVLLAPLGKIIGFESATTSKVYREGCAITEAHGAPIASKMTLPHPINNSSTCECLGADAAAHETSVADFADVVAGAECKRSR